MAIFKKSDVNKNATNDVSVDSPETIKRRQKTLVIGGIGGLFVIIFGILILTDHSGDVSAKNTKDEIRKTSINVPSSNLNVKEIWIQQSEEKFSELEKQNNALMNRLSHLEKALNHARRENKASSEKSAEKLSHKKSEKSVSNGFPGLALSPFGGPTKTVTTAAKISKDLGSPLPPPPVGGNFRRVKNSENDFNSPGLSSGQRSPIGKPGNSKSNPMDTGNGIFLVSLEDSSTKTPANTGKKKQVKRADNYLPAGSFSQAVLLSGLDAPTGGQAQDNPQPVLLKLTSNTILPNRWRSKTRECLITGAAYGDLSSERAYARTETLSCVLKDGTVIETVLNGFLSGEDGKAGLRGTVISKQGRIIGLAALAGLGAGFGSAARDGLGTVSTSPLGSTRTLDTKEVFKSGAYTGFANAMDRISQFYIKMADQLFPIVEVPAGRTITVILTKGAFFGNDVSTDNTGKLAKRGFEYPRKRNELASVKSSGK